MGKLLSWIAIGLLIWFGFKMLQVSQRRQQEAARRADPSADGPPAGAPGQGPQSLAGERMVRCEHCGVHLPVSEAVTAGPHHYCSPAHRDAGPAA